MEYTIVSDDDGADGGDGGGYGGGCLRLRMLIGFRQ